MNRKHQDHRIKLNHTEITLNVNVSNKPIPRQRQIKKAKSNQVQPVKIAF